ncbi:aconitase X catalytic domain-containing protein [Polycladidibacter stylochi]|uniref:aconitase X catalytic domain-containing protein n=1 Tax=Polycladidibacter stylochi TaxID=1807766 RepID=UPI0008299B4F|nr:aconitase X catalytic domain-containing protein [Pseudovibrio stylochi]
MHLTDYEKALLQGDHGEARRMAMNVLYDMAQYYEVDRFVEIVSCHDDSTVYFGEAQVAFTEHLVDIGGKFAVPTSTNACALDMNKWKEQRHDRSWMTATRRIEASHLQLGAAANWTCAPYQAGFAPSFGQQVACAESNVINYVNSIIGARTNRYAGPLELLAGIAGRVPYFGLHKTENRKAVSLMRLADDITPDMFEDNDIYNLISHLYGKIAGDQIWALEGMPTNVTLDNLKQFSSTAASSGGIALFHLIGLTPEAHTLEMAFQGGKPEKEVLITKEMLREAEQDLCNFEHEGKVDLISIGCPHFSYAEFEALEQAFAGRKLPSDTEFWVFTSRCTQQSTTDSGLLDRIKALGVKVFLDGCTMEYPIDKWDTKSIMTNSGKFANYCYSKIGIHPVFGNYKDCVETAIAGKVVRAKKKWWN